MKTYQNVRDIIRNSPVNSKLYVVVFYKNERHDWLPVDKQVYLDDLQLINNIEIPYPCFFEVDRDGDMYIHTRWKNK